MLRTPLSMVLYERDFDISSRIMKVSYTYVYSIKLKFNYYIVPNSSFKHS